MAAKGVYAAALMHSSDWRINGFHPSIGIDIEDFPPQTLEGW